MEESLEHIIKKLSRNPNHFKLKDKEGHPSVCDFNYTQYLFSSSNSKNNQFTLVHSDHKRGTPVFVNINGRNPIHLFVGCYTAAAVDTEGSSNGARYYN